MNRSWKNRPGFLLLAACAALWTGGAGSGCEEGTGRPDGVYTCAVDQALLEREIPCLDDDACVCGTHCVLGLCQYDCRADADCGAGLYCDGFGRCTAGGERQVGMASRGTLALDRARIDLLADESTRRVRVTASALDSGPVRVVAGEGVEVQCTDGEPFGRECGLAGVPAGVDGVLLAVRPAGAVPAAEEVASSVTVFGEGQRLSVAVRLGGIAEAKVDRDPGVYRGFFRPLRAGSAARTSVQDLSTVVQEIRLPVTLTVFPLDGETHMVSIVDEFSVLFPSGQGVGRIVFNASGVWELQLPARHLIGPATPAADEVEVYVAASASELSWSGGALAGEVRSAFEGVTTPTYTPFLEWELSASWAEELPSGAVEPTWPGDYTPAADAATRAEVALPIESLVRTMLSTELATLGVDATSFDRAEAIVCTADGATDTATLDDSILQIGGRDALSGDLACDQGGTLAAAPTFGLMASSVLRVNENVAACLADLDDVRLAVEEGDDEAPLRTRGCVAAGRTIAALGYALEPDRLRALGDPSTPSPTATTVGHRLLQQWLEMNVFVAQEARQVQALNDVLGDSAVDQDFTVPDAFLAALHGWDLILHPRIGIPLAAASASTLLDPDYRDVLFAAAGLPDRNTFTQQNGIAVAMLDALGKQLDVLGSLVEDARSRRLAADDVQALVVEATPRVFVVLSLAQALHDTANAAAVPAWEPEWTSALEGTSARIRGLMEAIAMMLDDSNPLGIEEGDLPLYRVGDEASANQRFSALSDYLVGAFGDETAAASYMVAQATTMLEAARVAWLANVERDEEAELAEAARQERADAARAEAEGVVAALCGLDSFSLDEAATFNQATCHVKPDCTVTDADLMARMSTAELGYGLCTTTLLRQRFGTAVALPTSPASLATELNKLAGSFANPASRFPFAVADFTGSGDTLSAVLENAAGATLATIPVRALGKIETHMQSGFDSGSVEHIMAHCMAMQQETEEYRPALTPASCSVADDCPADNGCQAGACVPGIGGSSSPPSCMRGTIGAQVLALRSASLEVQAARSELSDAMQRYEVAMKSCKIMADSNVAENILLGVTNGALTVMGGAKLVCDIQASFFSAAFAVGGAPAPWDKGVATVAGLGVAMNQSVSLGLGFAMTELERYRNMALDFMQDHEEETICVNDASMELVGIRTASLRIDQAGQGAAAAQLEMETLQRELRTTLSGASVAVDEAAGRIVSPVATDFWLDESVSRYRAALRRARRVVYLAAVAAQYEFQLSLPVLDDVLRARSPVELAAVIDTLRAYTATGTVGGAAPSDLVTVVSIRDNLRQIADLSGTHSGWHAMSPEERLSLVLTSPEFAVHDVDGSYLGQEIPFTISPFGTLGIGSGQGIPLLTGTDCAERLWSVNASLLGTDVYTGSDTTFARVVLRKRNTFYSQWCQDAPATPFQVASTRPSRNLFLDPYSEPGDSEASHMPQPDPAVVDEVNGFTDARISAYFNVTQAELEDEAYFNGDSQELAARGLFGDYALFFPAETLSTAGGTGLHLDRIDDILLRLDYVSVAR